MTAPARPGPRLTAEEMAAIRERDAEWDGGDPRDRWQTRERIDDAFRDRRALLAEVDALVADIRNVLRAVGPHDYDLSYPILDSSPQQASCFTCDRVHWYPVHAERTEVIGQLRRRYPPPGPERG